LLLDEVDEFAPKLFPITTCQDTPLWAKWRGSEMGGPYMGLAPRPKN
jgi:hypothetical protein